MPALGSMLTIDPQMSRPANALKRIGKSYLVLGLWLLALGYWLAACSHLGPERASDFALYYLDGRAFWEGRNPYTPADFVLVHSQFRLPGIEADRSNDPPAFILLVAPLSRLRYDRAYWLWALINMAALAGALLLLLHSLSRNLDRSSLWIIGALALLYHPVNVNWSFGQSKIIILFLLALTLHGIESGYAAVAGTSLALATLLRLFPALLFGYLILQHQWRIVLYAGAALLIGAIGTLLIVGPGFGLEFFQALPYLTSASVVRNLGDIAPYAAVMRLFAGLSTRPGLVLPHDLLRLMAWVPGLLAFGFTLAVTIAQAPMRDTDWRLFSLWVATAMMILPVAWQYDMVVLLIPFVEIAAAAARRRTSRRAVLAMAISYFLPASEWILRHLSAMAGSVYAVVAASQVLVLIAAYLSAYWFVTDAPDGVTEGLNGQQKDGSAA
jgi:hypothetical protein